MSYFGEWQCPVCKRKWTGSIGWYLPNPEDWNDHFERVCGCTGKRLEQKIMDKMQSMSVLKGERVMTNDEIAKLPQALADLYDRSESIDQTARSLRLLQETIDVQETDKWVDVSSNQLHSTVGYAGLNKIEEMPHNPYAGKLNEVIRTVNLMIDILNQELQKELRYLKETTNG